MGWNQSIFSLLIVTFGQQGQGFFIYNGAPALGNPPVLSVTGGTADPFGNPVTPSLSVSSLPILVYNGPPGPGTLYASVASFNGADTFGNHFDSGYQIYGSGGSNIELTVLLGIPRAFFSTGVAEESAGTSAVIEAQISNPGASEQIFWFLTGPRIGLGTPAAMTVTATNSGTHSGPGLALAVEVWTGQAAVPLGAIDGTQAANPPQQSITPTVVGSKIFGALGNEVNATTFTPNGITSFDVNSPDANWGAALATFHSAITTSLAALTIGATAPAVNCHYAAAELLPRAGGPGLALDASSPAIPTPVQSGSGLQTLSTASFTPPPGSIIVARVASNYDGSGLAFTQTVTGGGLTWNMVETDGANVATVWFAVVPPLTPAAFVSVNMAGQAKDGSILPFGQHTYTDTSAVTHTLLSWGPNGVQVESMQPGDTNIYLCAELRQLLPADVLVNSTSFTQVFGGWVLGVGSYEFDGYLKVLPNVNGGQVLLLLATAGCVATLQVEVVETIEGSPGTLGKVQALGAFGANFTGTAFNAGIGRTIQLHGTLNVTTAGIVAFEVATSVAADTYTLQKLGSYLNLKPVNS